MFKLFSLGSDIGFSMFTLRENLDGFLKEVEVGFVSYELWIPTEKCAQVGLARYPEGENTANLVLQRLPLVCTFVFSA